MGLGSRTAELKLRVKGESEIRPGTSIAIVTPFSKSLSLVLKTSKQTYVLYSDLDIHTKKKKGFGDPCDKGLTQEIQVPDISKNPHFSPQQLLVADSKERRPKVEITSTKNNIPLLSGSLSYGPQEEKSRNYVITIDQFM